LRPSARFKPADPATRLVDLAALGLALQPPGARRPQLLAPLPGQAVGDLVIATQLGHRL
jgi:hypothetical protein